MSPEKCLYHKYLDKDTIIGGIWYFPFPELYSHPPVLPCKLHPLLSCNLHSLLSCKLHPVHRLPSCNMLPAKSLKIHQYVSKVKEWGPLICFMLNKDKEKATLPLKSNPSVDISFVIGGTGAGWIIVIGGRKGRVEHVYIYSDVTKFVPCPRDLGNTIRHVCFTPNSLFILNARNVEPFFSRSPFFWGKKGY